jgi:ribokinase
MPPKPLCLVRSSLNIDEMFAVPHVVRPGETISSSSLTSRPGGKGANVSAAVALAGQQVFLGGSVGKDATWPIDELKKRGVNVDSVRVLDDVPTGRAFIQVAEDGENSIVLLKGANFHPDDKADDPAMVFSSLPSPPTHLIVQNEIVLSVTKAFLSYAHSSSLRSPCTTVFNPSPMLSYEEIQEFNWEDVDVLIVNEGEGRDLIGPLGDENCDGTILEALDSLERLKNTSWIVVTKGGDGVSAAVRVGKSQGNREYLDVHAIKPKRVIDTTGAGDTFAGNLVAGLMSTSKSPLEILQWASLAASMVVETDGAMESIPTHQDVAARKREITNGS